MGPLTESGKETVFPVEDSTQEATENLIRGEDWGYYTTGRW